MTDFCDQTANAGVYVRHVRGVNLGTWYYTALFPFDFPACPGGWARALAGGSEGAPARGWTGA